MHHNTPEHTALATAADVQLTDAERQPCEVWTRVMGYHRPVAELQPSASKSEHHERRHFAEPVSNAPDAELVVGGITPLTTIDFPPAAWPPWLYGQGCPWRCGLLSQPATAFDATTPATVPWG
jgi:hypothetical protein